MEDGNLMRNVNVKLDIYGIVSKAHQNVSKIVVKQLLINLVQGILKQVLQINVNVWMDTNLIQLQVLHLKINVY